MKSGGRAFRRGPTTWRTTLRSRIAATFGEDALLQPTLDPQLKSAIVCFNPFPDVRQRCDPDVNIEFRQRLLREYGFRISGGGVGPDGFTRAPDPEAAAFPVGLIPNRDPDTLAPKPFGYPLRVNACVWNTVVQMDRFVAAAQDLVRKMTARRPGAAVVAMTFPIVSS